jgi:GNAT superfamily N-acetyltransferase
MAELGAFFGNPNVQRQGARARALAEQRDVNTLPDPLTYAVVQGLLGTRPDEMGFSVLNPDYEKIRKAAEPAFALGLIGQASPLLAPLTKGLPVGASIKSIDDIFKKYPDVTIDASVGKKDINLSRIVVPKEMRNQGVGTQVMSDLSEYADNIGKRITLTPSSDFGGSVPKLKAFYKELGFVENKGKNKDFSTREAMYREPQPVDAKPSYPQQEALDTAQRNAALTVDEGGLGLPKDNTPEMRAMAMGFDTPVYHATDVAEDFSIFTPSTKGKLGAGIYTSPSAKYTEKYVDDNARIMPLLTRGNYANEDVGTEISDKIRQEMYDIDPNFAVQEWKARASQELKNLGYAGKDVDKERVVFNPENVRSRFAAFDPMRKNEADILAGVLPLGLLADEEQRKKLYELMPSLLGQ